MSKAHRSKRKRRQGKQALKFGRHAKPKHMLQAGRTGSVFSKKLKSRRGKRKSLPKEANP